jgi:hypothetical protein
MEQSKGDEHCGTVKYFKQCLRAIRVQLLQDELVVEFRPRNAFLPYLRLRV